MQDGYDNAVNVTDYVDITCQEFPELKMNEVQEKNIQGKLKLHLCYLPLP